MEKIKKLTESDDWPPLRYDDPEYQVPKKPKDVLYLPTIPQKIKKLEEEIEQIKLKLKEL
tara:strand:+ start:690 stop:869 length:180 start_codon:yes stop_codon:yes gene_type:complete